MDKKSEFISKTFEIAAGVIVGYITYKVSAPTSDLAVFIWRNDRPSNYYGSNSAR